MTTRVEAPPGAYIYHALRRFDDYDIAHIVRRNGRNVALIPTGCRASLVIGDYEYRINDYRERITAAGKHDSAAIIQTHETRIALNWADPQAHHEDVLFRYSPEKLKVISPKKFLEDVEACLAELRVISLSGHESQRLRK